MSIDTVFQATCCISSCCAASNNPTARYLVLHLKCYVATVRDRGREASPKRQRLRRQRNKRPRATQGGEHAAVHQMYHHILTHTHTHTHTHMPHGALKNETVLCSSVSSPDGFCAGPRNASANRRPCSRTNDRRVLAVPSSLRRICCGSAQRAICPESPHN
jgi:hypothetical protein